MAEFFFCFFCLKYPFEFLDVPVFNYRELPVKALEYVLL